MITEIRAAQLPSSGEWITFQPGADLSGYDPAKVATWSLTGDEPTPTSLIRTNDRIIDFGLRRDNTGRYVEAAYDGAYRIAFALEHLKKIDGPLGVIETPGRGQIEALPPDILAAYVTQAGRTGRVLQSDMDFLRKPPSASPPDLSGDASA